MRRSSEVVFGMLAADAEAGGLESAHNTHTNDHLKSKSSDDCRIFAESVQTLRDTGSCIIRKVYDFVDKRLIIIDN